MDYFSNTEKHVIPFSPVVEEHRDLIDMAFSKKRADDRKEWLRGFKVRSSVGLNIRQKLTLTFSGFIRAQMVFKFQNIQSVQKTEDGSPLLPSEIGNVWNVSLSVKSRLVVGRMIRDRRASMSPNESKKKLKT